MRHHNQMEPSDGNAIRHRGKVMRGLEREDAMLAGLQPCRDFAGPRPGPPDQTAPAGAAGIGTPGGGKFPTSVQAAARSRSPAA